MYMTLSAGSEVWHTHDGGPSYDDLKRHVGEGAERDLFDVVRLPNGIDLWVNDEGLIVSEFLDDILDDLIHRQGLH